jgi:hypothetical protein
MPPDRIIVLLLGLDLYFMQWWITHTETWWIIFAMIFVAMVLAFIINNERVIAEYFEPVYRYGGIAGRYVDTMAAIYLLRYTPTVYVIDFERFDHRNRIDEIDLKPRIEAVDSYVADDETCAICLQEKKDDPSLLWVIAVGCSRHKYHRECVKPWRGSHCMTCRAPITQLW